MQTVLNKYCRNFRAIHYDMECLPDLNNTFPHNRGMLGRSRCVLIFLETFGSAGYSTNNVLLILLCVCVCVCVFFPFILDIKFVGRTSRSHRRKVTQDFSSTFFLRCVP